MELFVATSWNIGYREEKDPRVRKYCFNLGNFKKGQEKPEGSYVFSEGHPKYGGTQKGYRYPAEHEAWNKGLNKETDERVAKYSKKLEGREFSDETRRKLSLAKREAYSDPRDHPCWQGGRSFDPYDSEFNDDLKRRIRERDNHSCQGCSITEEDLGVALDIHHVDFDKHNNEPNNLVSLCRSCHIKLHWEKEWKVPVENARDVGQHIRVFK